MSELVDKVGSISDQSYLDTIALDALVKKVNIVDGIKSWSHYAVSLELVTVDRHRWSQSKKIVVASLR